jgi:hypothetical protein
MFLLILVLYDENYVREILRKFVEIDVRGATLINSEGMALVVSNEIPIFSSLRHMISGENEKSNNFTIFSAIKTEETLNKAVETVLNIVKDIDKPGTGIMVVLPVLKIYGLAEKT